MNSITRLINKMVIGSNRLIEGLDKKTALAIKQGFFFLVFICAVAGAFYGIKKGLNAAKIKSPPLAKNTTDLFSIDIHREKGDKNFTSMINSEMLSEMDKSGPRKIPFRRTDRLKPEPDAGLIEPEKSLKERPSPDTENRNIPLDGSYRRRPAIKSDVRPLERRQPFEEGGSSAKNKKKRLPEILRPASEKISDKKKKTDTVTHPERIPLIREKREPRMLNRDTGIINR